MILLTWIRNRSLTIYELILFLSFLDTTIKLAADLLKLQAEYQQAAVLTNEQAEEVQSSWDPEPYKSLLAKLYCSSPNPEICDECDAPTDSVSDYRRHLIRDHLGLENWKVRLIFLIEFYSISEAMQYIKNKILQIDLVVWLSNAVKSEWE